MHMMICDVASAYSFRLPKAAFRPSRELTETERQVERRKEKKARRKGRKEEALVIMTRRRKTINNRKCVSEERKKDFCNVMAHFPSLRRGCFACSCISLLRVEVVAARPPLFLGLIPCVPLRTPLLSSFALGSTCIAGEGSYLVELVN